MLSIRWGIVEYFGLPETVAFLILGLRKWIAVGAVLLVFGRVGLGWVWRTLDGGCVAGGAGGDCCK